MKTLAVFAVVAVSVVACADDPSTPSDHMKIFQTCLRTQCDDITESGNSACDACNSACFAASYDCDPSSACDSSCSPRECSDYDRSTCEEQGFKVVPANDPSADIAAACRRELSHVASCGYSTSETSSDCDRYAANELPERASNYDCVAQLDCASLGDTNAFAACDPPASTFGDDFCATLATQCPDNACSATRQATLNAEGAWVRPDALDAARSCLAQATCSDTSDCVSAWVDAVE